MGHVLNIHGVNDVRLDPIDSPRPGNSDVVVKVKACGYIGDFQYADANILTNTQRRKRMFLVDPRRYNSTYVRSVGKDL